MDSILTLGSEWSIFGIILRLLVAALAGIVIGMDREIKNKGAGIKTYALVCIGAAMAMIVNEYVLRNLTASNTDVARMGAQVISGIGFLGAGTILVTGQDRIKGLTTAAGIWASAGIGLAAGIGFIIGALAALVFVFFILRVLDPFDKFLKRKAREMDIYVIFNDQESIIQFMDLLSTRGIELKDLDLQKTAASGNHPTAVITVKIPGGTRKEECIAWIGEMKGIRNVRELEQ